MAFQISPGVNVSEIDLTTVVPSVLTTAGAFVGRFTWGPANKIKLIDSEINLIKSFGEPTSNSAIPFFTAANFLSYGNNLQIVRAVNANTFNSDSKSSNTNIQITNEDIYEVSYLNVNSANVYGPIMARYPGTLGNSIKVEVLILQIPHCLTIGHTKIISHQHQEHLLMFQMLAAQMMRFIL